MATFLFDQIIFGPVKSRRLGVSLGVNLLPTTSKVCSFDCIYCECGWTKNVQSSSLPTRSEVKAKMLERFVEMKSSCQPLDVITFAGNGEPTLHPDFDGIIDDTIELRNSYFPDARVAVLSNSSMLHKPEIVEALCKVDQNILKLDSAIDSTITLLNKPHISINVDILIDNLKRLNGNFILQTMFVRGSYLGQIVDNTTEKEIEKWLSVIQAIKPKEVMIYTIARDTPIDTLVKVSKIELQKIADKVTALGIPVQVSA